MTINNKEPDNSIRAIKCKEQILENVSTYKFLDSIVTNDGKIDLDTASRIRKATNIHYSLNKTLSETVNQSGH